MPGSIAQHISAALLFSLKDVRHFVEWQKEHRPEHQPSQIQDSIENCEFLEYQRGNVAIAKFERSRARARIKNSATKCGHKLHLSDIISTGYCPVCEVDMCLTFLDALGKVFQKCGGPWPQEITKREYIQVRQCWHLARFSLAEVVDSLEIGRKYEEMWEKQHPNDAGKVWMTNSSTKATRKAETENKYPAVISEPPASPAPVPKQRLGAFEEAWIKVAKDMKKKHVTFTRDTVNWPVRHQSAFSRDPKNKPYYDTPNGRHPAPLGVEWIDTSHANDRIADLLNLKVYATRVQAEFDAFLEDQTLRPLSRYDGIVGMHRGIAAISKYVNSFLSESETTRKEMYEIDGADSLAILVNGYVVKDMCFMRSDDVETRRVLAKRRWIRRGGRLEFSVSLRRSRG